MLAFGGDMNIKRFIVAVMLGFAFIFGFDTFWHGQLLMEHYQQTASLWRSQENMQAYFPVILITQFLMSLIVVYLFAQNYEGKGIGEGIRFGLPVGLLIGILLSGSYAYMPITAFIAGMWLLGGILIGLGLGIISALVYRH